MAAAGGALSDGSGVRVAAGGVALVARFAQAADRLGHAIEVETGGGPGQLPLLVSSEGASGEIWPASAALQSVSLEQQADGRRVALLVGMAGRSHWSASIEECASNGSLVFDFACRTSQPPEFLGSTYRLASGVEVADISDDKLLLSRGEARVLLVAEVAGEFPPPRIERRGDLLVLAAIAGDQKTIRWKYRLQVDLASEY